jgi:hypothetical protein
VIDIRRCSVRSFPAWSIARVRIRIGRFIIDNFCCNGIFCSDWNN